MRTPIGTHASVFLIDFNKSLETVVETIVKWGREFAEKEGKMVEVTP